MQTDPGIRRFRGLIGAIFLKDATRTFGTRRAARKQRAPKVLPNVAYRRCTPKVARCHETYDLGRSGQVELSYPGKLLKKIRCNLLTSEKTGRAFLDPTQHCRGLNTLRIIVQLRLCNLFLCALHLVRSFVSHSLFGGRALDPNNNNKM